MVRTQIYLTERQRDELAAIAKIAGKKQSELIREAVDRLIDQEGQRRREAVLRKVAGIWKDRADLPDFRVTRADWDKYQALPDVEGPQASLQEVAMASANAAKQHLTTFWLVSPGPL